MSYHGDYAEDFADLNFKFTTHNRAGVPTTLSGSPVASVYKSNDTTQSVAGVTLTADFDSVAGLNNVKIDLSADAFYETGKDYDVVITTGTVDSQSIAGYVVGSFSIENRSALRPTGAGRVLSVTAGGAVDVVSQVTGLASDAITEASIENGAITASKIANDAITAAKIATDAVAEIADQVWDEDIVSFHQTADTAGEQLRVANSRADAIQGAGFNTGIHSLVNISSQIGSLAVGSGGISVTASAFVKAGAEPETNTFTSTHEEDGVFHIVEDDATSTDIYYQFNIGGTGVPQSVEWFGYVQSQNDTYAVFFWNWGASAWEQVGSLDASNSTNPVSEQFIATTAHVGTGVNLGLVRFRFLSSDGTAVATDRILCTYAVVQSALGFVNGAVWIDTVGGESGTTEGIGTISRPVDNIADARTIADANNLKSFNLLPASSITLAQSFDSYDFTGAGYTVALGGQSLSGATFMRATITGNDDGSNGTPTLYVSCNMGNNTLGAHILNNCRMAGDLVLAEAADYFWDQCYSGVAGTATPSVDFESAAETKNLSIRHYSGGMEFKNHGTGGGTHASSIEGFGQVIINANCAGGTIAIRGNFTVTDNAGGVVTLSDDARVETTHRMAADVEAIAGQTDSAVNLDASAEQILLGMVDDSAFAPTTTEFESDDLVNINPDQFNGRSVIFRTGNLAGLATDITDYAQVSSNGHFTVTAMNQAPADGDTFVVV